MIVVVSQPMLFPWIGMLEQVRLADTYVHYNDVQFSKGSFVNRVQVKTENGPRWLTVPLANLHLGQRIDEIAINNQRPWREQHLALLAQAYVSAPFRETMLELVRDVYAHDYPTLDALSAASMMALCRYYGLDRDRRFIDVGTLGINGKGSERVLRIVKAVGGVTYVTGHGARNYLDHGLFEAAGVTVEYMNYQKVPYAQQHGDFTPYVSGLDLIANCGRDGGRYICSATMPWKDFIDGPH